MDQEPSFNFTSVEAVVASLQTAESKEQLVQYNLDQSLHIYKFRFTGFFAAHSAADYEQLCKDFFCSAECLAGIQATGSPSLPVEYDSEQLTASVMNMDFFDRLTEAGIITESGHIRGCYDEIYDDITVSDKLREMLLNPDSENATVYSETDKKELIYQILRLFVVGGALCQPESNFERYLNLTKAVYKELVTIYRDSKTEKVQIAGRVFKITRVHGVELFPANPSSPHNTMILIVDPLKKIVTVVKNNFTSFW